MLKDTVKKLIEESLEKRPSLFLLDFQVSQSNQIRVILDGDKPVKVKECVEISREIEKELNEDFEDFSLEVSSAGLTTPLTLPRQFRKNIGRKLKIKTADQKYKANLIKADEDGIELQWKQREPKPIGKGKHTVTKQVELKYNEIEQAKVVITFN